MLSLLALAGPADDGAKPDGALPDFDDLRPTISCCIRKDILAAPVREAMPELRACWEGLPAPERRQDLKVRLVYTLAKGEDRASDISVTGGTETLAQCIANEVEAMRWDRAMPCEAKVTYPIRFSARSSSSEPKARPHRR